MGELQDHKGELDKKIDSYNTNEDITMEPPSIDFIEPANYVLVRGLLEKPKISPTPASRAILSAALPFILQRVKMWGAHVLQPRELSTMMDAPMDQGGEDSAAAEMNEPTFDDDFDSPWLMEFEDGSPDNSNSMTTMGSINRLDLFHLLVESTDTIVLQDIFRILSLFPIALPLVVPSNDNEKREDAGYKILTPLFHNCIARWGTSGGTVSENHLLQSPFKMIGAIRIGQSPPAGKSSILNQILKKDAYIFSSSQEAGSEFGKPSSAHGTIEMTWLTQETCSNAFWDKVHEHHYSTLGQSSNAENQVLLLANLHGNALDLRDHIRFLEKVSYALVLFIMPGVKKVDYENFKSLLSPELKLLFLKVDPPKFDLKDKSSVSTTLLTNDANLSKVISVFAEAMKAYKDPEVEIQMTKLPQYFNQIKASTLVPLKPVETELSTTLLERISNYFRTIANSPGLLTGLKQCFSIRHQIPESSCVREFVAKRSSSPELLHLFAKILQQPIQNRRASLVHLDAEISKMTLHVTLAIRKELASQRRLLNELHSSRWMDEEDDQREEKIKNTRQKITGLYRELDEKSLGMEHLYRELSYLFAKVLATGKSPVLGDIDPKVVLKCPEKCAQMLLEGQAIEILDGDLVEISHAWLDHVLHSVCNLRSSPMKVFVVSIIGLQSSGKSTLLNALFGCKFAVSAGRCTRGLFLRLLLVEETLSKKIGVEAILLIDTEGLGAPEKMNDLELTKHDRMMATFAVSLSNLTIVNVLGETLKEIQEILQIVIVTMGRLKDADLDPEILVVQHTSEKNLDLRAQAADQFKEALVKAVDTVMAESLRLGVDHVKSVNFMKQSFTSTEFIYEFPTFKDGATVAAPPSLHYHNEVTKLFNVILTRASRSKIDFHTWHNRVHEFWVAVKGEEFSLQFKNIVEFQEFNKRNDRMALIEEMIFAAATAHQQVIKINLSHLASKGRQQVDKRYVDHVIDISDKILEHCTQGQGPTKNEGPSHVDQSKKEAGCMPCPSCQTANDAINKFLTECQGQPHEMQIKGTLADYTARCKKGSVEMMTNYFLGLQIQADSCSKFEHIIDRCLNEILAENDSKIRDLEKRNIHINQIWERVKMEVSSTSQTIQVRMTEIFGEIRDEYHIKNRDKVELSQNMGLDSDVIKENLIKVKLQPSNLADRFKNGLPGVDTTIPLTLIQREELSEMIRGITPSFLESCKSSHYEIGASYAPKLRAAIVELVGNFEKKHNQQFHSKMLVTQMVIHAFFSAIRTVEVRWLQGNSPLGILESKKKFYRNKINNILQHGFGTAAEATNLADSLKTAIGVKVHPSTEVFLQNKILGLKWTETPANLRERYLIRLARKVQKSILPEALNYFLDPVSQLRSWFLEVVDKVGVNEQACEFLRLREKEKNLLIKKIAGSNSIDQIASMAEADYGHYTSPNFHTVKEETRQDATMTNFAIFREKLIENLKTLEADDVTPCFSKASQNKTILRRLGCTETCYWCGAICWDHMGHSGCHWTVHQPMGFTLLTNNKSELSNTACHTIKDDMVVRWGDFRGPWKLAKKQPQFKNWRFTPHDKQDMHDLMNWFFSELNVELAEYENVKAHPRKGLVKSLVVTDQWTSIIGSMMHRVGMDECDEEEAQDRLIVH